MFPILAEFELAGHPVVLHAYGTLLIAAAVAALALGLFGARRAGFPVRVIGIVYIAAIVAGLIGARALDVAFHQDLYAADPEKIIALGFRGFGLYGGLAAGLTVGVISLAALCRRHGISLGLTFGRLADSAIPAVVVGIVLLRIGCFLNGCCAGIATDLPWGVVFPGDHGLGVLGISSDPAAVHPTQIYELLAAIACGIMALAVTRRHRDLPAGTAALVFVVGFLFFRAADQVLRTPTFDDPAATFLPAAYLGGAFVALTLLGGVIVTARERRMRETTVRIAIA